jgi:hypothetical protein
MFFSISSRYEDVDIIGAINVYPGETLDSLSDDTVSASGCPAQDSTENGRKQSACNKRVSIATEIALLDDGTFCGFRDVTIGILLRSLLSGVSLGIIFDPHGILRSFRFLEQIFWQLDAPHLGQPPLQHRGSNSDNGNECLIYTGKVGFFLVSE